MRWQRSRSWCELPTSPLHHSISTRLVPGSPSVPSSHLSVPLVNSNRVYKRAPLAPNR